MPPTWRWVAGSAGPVHGGVFRWSSWSLSSSGQTRAYLPRPAATIGPIAIGAGLRASAMRGALAASMTVPMSGACLACACKQCYRRSSTDKLNTHTHTHTHTPPRCCLDRRHGQL
jgi:hypothetical protein